MAYTIHSYGVSAGADSATCTIVKPSGLEVGDIMVAFPCSIKDSSPHTSCTPPSGWTELNFTSSGIFAGVTYWKIAESADVAASNFAFGFGGGSGNPYTKGVMLRITGGRQSTVGYVKNEGSGGVSTAVSVPGFTPTVADSLLLFFVGWGGNVTSDTGASGYAIATDNPMWTELVELAYDEGVFVVNLAVAYAERPETTATGNFTATLTAGDHWIGQPMAIEPAIASSVSDSVTIGDQGQTSDLDFNQADSVSLQENTDTDGKRQWSNLNKTDNSPTITNLDK